MHSSILKLFLFAFGLSFFTGGDQVDIVSKPALSDPKAVLENLKAFYTDHPYVYHELRYTLYASHQATTPYSTDQGIFIQNGDIRYAQLASVESLTTADYTVGVDHDDRMLMIANRISLPPTVTPVDQLEVWTADPELVEVQYASEQYDLLLVKTEYGEVEQAEIWYDKSTYQPGKIIFKYRRSMVLETDSEGDPVQPRVEIEYRNTGFEGQGRERLALDSYVVQKNGAWESAPAFRDYELINSIHPFPSQN